MIGHGMRTQFTRVCDVQFDKVTKLSKDFEPFRQKAFPDIIIRY